MGSWKLEFSSHKEEHRPGGLNNRNSWEELKRGQKKDLILLCQGGQHFWPRTKNFNQNLFHQFINLLLKNTQSKKALKTLPSRKPYRWLWFTNKTVSVSDATDWSVEQRVEWQFLKIYGIFYLLKTLLFQYKEKRTSTLAMMELTGATVNNLKVEQNTGSNCSQALDNR